MTSFREVFAAFKIELADSVHISLEVVIRINAGSTLHTMHFVSTLGGWTSTGLVFSEV